MSLGEAIAGNLCWLALAVLWKRQQRGAASPMQTTANRIPELDVDLFSEASLRDPFDDYQRLRDAAAVVHLRRPEVYALGRFDDVQAALRNPDLLRSGHGVGFSEAFNAPRGMNVLQSDGDLHRRLRAAVMRPLWPAKLREAREIGRAHV